MEIQCTATATVGDKPWTSHMLCNWSRAAGNQHNSESTHIHTPSIEFLDDLCGTNGVVDRSRVFFHLQETNDSAPAHDNHFNSLPIVFDVTFAPASETATDAVANSLSPRFQTRDNTSNQIEHSSRPPRTRLYRFMLNSPKRPVVVRSRKWRCFFFGSRNAVIFRRRMRSLRRVMM